MSKTDSERNVLVLNIIFIVTSIVRNRLNEGNDTFIALIDMEKAFDRIKRSLLLFRLLEFNIDGKIYKAIKALYTNNSAFVRLNSQISTDWFDVPNGVPNLV